MSQTEEARPGSPRWWQDRPQRDGGTDQRPGRPAMPVDRVIVAALELIDEVGPDEFSMRMLAKRLGSSTATLYRHFAGKDEIFVHVVDHVLGELPRYLAGMAEVSTWQERLIGSAEAMFQTLKVHPRVVSLFDDQAPLGPRALAGREAALSILLASGFTPEVAARAFTAIGHYIIGFATQFPTDSTSDSGSDEETQGIREYFRSLDPDRYPATLISAAFLPSSLDEEFHFGLQLIVDGLAKHRTDNTQE